MVLNWLRVDVAAEVRLIVGSQPIDFTCHGDGEPALLLESIVSMPEGQSGPFQVEIEVSRLRCPFFDSGRTSPDQRWLGVCVHWIELEPIEA